MGRLPKNFDNISKYIVSDMQDRVGKKIAKDMVQAYNRSIRSFYDDYTPVVYKRKYRSYFFAHPDGTLGYVKFYKKDKDGNGIEISMNVTSDNIKIPYTSITGNYFGKRLNELVFYNTFVLGQHGGMLPLNILPEETQQGIMDNTKSTLWGYRKNKGWVWNPPSMVKNGTLPPKGQMDKWFVDYTQFGKLDNIIHKELDKSILKILKDYMKQHIN